MSVNAVNLDLELIWGHIKTPTVSLCQLSKTGKSMSEQNNPQPNIASSLVQLGGSFSLSENAATRIAKLLDSEPAGSFFRVAVLGGGCSGFQYDFSIDQNRQNDDFVFVAYDVEVVVDEMSLELIDQAEIDYVQDLMGSYFTVTNPNATASCGCGTSFSV